MNFYQIRCRVSLSSVSIFDRFYDLFLTMGASVCAHCVEDSAGGCYVVRAAVLGREKRKEMENERRRNICDNSKVQCAWALWCDFVSGDNQQFYL